MHRALNLNSGDTPSQLQEGGGETNEMNAIIKVDGQTERGKPQRNEEKKAGRSAMSSCYCTIQSRLMH